MKYVFFDKSPLGFHVYHQGRQHPVGYLKETAYKSGLFCIIHNKLGAAEQAKQHSLADAKRIVSNLINGKAAQ